MNILQKIGQAAGGAAEKIWERTRRSAALSRIRTVISSQEKLAEKEYLALGRYYYNNLRDSSEPLTEAHCRELDQLNEKLDRALAALEELYRCDGPTAVVFAKEEDREEVDLDDVKKFDFDPEKAVASVKEAAGKAAQAAAPVVDAVKEKAGPVIQEIREKAAPVVETVKEKAAPVVETVKEKAAPVVETVKEKVADLTRKAPESAAPETPDAPETAEPAPQAEDRLYSKIQPKAAAKDPDDNTDLPFEG